ncbi:hypothetical protein DAKH74_018370 [Maudiozyma humilis]|uniref:PA14 domain-containing protein n=1 Tax=Maudiozyma humilis TaxID=51915 RepID=A0AAV5RVN9_MAUHU|nr:hypothetical protein DAKH74_018370 [Kazachstania humilis]
MLPLYIFTILLLCVQSRTSHAQDTFPFPPDPDTCQQAYLTIMESFGFITMVAEEELGENTDAIADRLEYLIDNIQDFEESSMRWGTQDLTINYPVDDPDVEVSNDIFGYTTTSTNFAFFAQAYFTAPSSGEYTFALTDLSENSGALLYVSGVDWGFCCEMLNQNLQPDLDDEDDVSNYLPPPIYYVPSDSAHNSPIITDVSSSEEPIITEPSSSDDPGITEYPSSSEPIITDVTSSEEPIVTDITSSDEPIITDITSSDEPIITDVSSSEEPIVTDITSSDGPIVTDVTSSDVPNVTYVTSSEEPIITDVTSSNGPIVTGVTSSDEPIITGITSSDDASTTDEIKDSDPTDATAQPTLTTSTITVTEPGGNVYTTVTVCTVTDAHTDTHTVTAECTSEACVHTTEGVIPPVTTKTNPVTNARPTDITATFMGTTTIYSGGFGIPHLSGAVSTKLGEETQNTVDHATKPANNAEYTTKPTVVAQNTAEGTVIAAGTVGTAGSTTRVTTQLAPTASLYHPDDVNAAVRANVGPLLSAAGLLLLPLLL